MLCNTCKSRQSINPSTGTCTTPGCGKYSASKNFALCRDCSKRSGRCEGCKQLIVHSGGAGPSSGSK